MLVCCSCLARFQAVLPCNKSQISDSFVVETDPCAFIFSSILKGVGMRSLKSLSQRSTVWLLRPARDSSDVKPLSGLPEAEIVSAFVALTPRQQSDLLQIFWERLKTPGMTHALEAVLEQPNRGDAMLRGLAIQGLFGLDRRAGRPYTLAEIRQPQSRGDTIMAQALTLLPDETLPE